MILIRNHGPLVIDSNYWDSDYARAGACYLSPNAGAFRLLIPESREAWLADMRTATEVLISRGPWPAAGRDDAIEILFDDHTQSPFALQIGTQQVERMPLPQDEAGEWLCTVWTRPRRGKPHKALERRAYYRIVRQIPYLKPRQQKHG